MKVKQACSFVIINETAQNFLFYVQW